MKKTEKMLKKDVFKLLAIGAVCLLFAGFAWSSQTSKTATEAETTALNFGTKEDISKAAFSEAYKVFMSPRCANCHPGGDVPTQNDEMTLHTQGIIRGADGKGKYGMKCTTCHQAENLEGEHLPPGVSSGWHMPPENMKMVFQGRTARQLCEQFKDPRSNGGKKTLKEAMEHLEADPLVLWGWSPGNGRSTPPLSHEEFMKNIHAWMDNGAVCPD